MSELAENQLKKFVLLHDDDVRNLEERANQLNLNLNTTQIIIACNYEKSCVLEKFQQYIEEKEQDIAAENQKKINQKRDKNH